MQLHSIIRQSKIVGALLQRELLVIKKSILSIALNSFSTLCADTLIFGYLLPQMGLQQQDIGPIYIGSIIIMITILCVVSAEHHVFDLAGNRFIDYLQTLPLSLPFLFTCFVLINMLRTALIGIPLFVLGILFLGHTLVLVQTSWFFLLITSFLSLLFISLLALCIAYFSDFQWYINNLWPCVLSPILSLGALLFTFKSIASFSRPFAVLFACNPLTYIAEGIRSALIGGPDFINIFYCIAALLVAIALSIILLTRNSITQLDPVYRYADKI